jgi:hypothetical protein
LRKELSAEAVAGEPATLQYEEAREQRRARAIMCAPRGPARPASGAARL